MKTTIRVTLLFLLLTAILGCSKKESSDVDPNIPFYQDYKMVYKKFDNITKAKATFREKNKDGTRLELKAPAKVLCNSQSSSFSNVGNYFYNWEFPGNADAHFQLTDNKSRVFNNSIFYSEIRNIDFKETFLKVDLNGTSVLAWIGEPLQEGEFVMVIITQGDQSSGSWFTDVTSATSIDLTKDLMFNLTTGNAEILLSRETHLGDVAEPDGDAGGQRIILVEVKKTIEMY